MSISSRRAVLMALAAAALVPASAQAAPTTWHVTTAGDPPSGTACPSSTKCSLRQAVADAHNGDAIVVPAFHIKLNSQLDISPSITIQGAGAGKTILDGQGANRVISVIGPPPNYFATTSSLTLRNLTVTGGAKTVANPGQNAGGAGIQFNSSGTLHLVAVAVTNNRFTTTGTTSPDDGGAGILSFSTIDIAGSVISGNALTVAGANQIDGGGGVLVLSGDLILAHSTVSGNTAKITEVPSPSGGNGGGGLMMGNEGGEDVILEGTTVAQNRVQILSGSGFGDGGGGLFQTGVSILSSGSTFSGNVANLTGDTGAGGGGAVLDGGGGGAYTNTTFSGNSVQDTAPATEQGGGAIALASNVSSLSNDTFASNAAGVGSGANLFDAGAEVHIHDTILSKGSAAAANCVFLAGEVVSDGHNLYDDPANSCQLTGAGDHHAASLGVGPLASNGGGVQTRALLTGSPAIDAGDPSGCTDAFGQPLTTDARGVARPQPAGGRCDIGACERAPGIAYTLLPGGVGKGTATLQGTAVNPDAVRATAHFQYGKTTSYGKTTAAHPVAAFTTSPVQAVLSKLAPGRYHYRLVVTNPDGTAHGVDRTFVIPTA
jgi:hypothetical protein